MTTPTLDEDEVALTEEWRRAVKAADEAHRKIREHFERHRAGKGSPPSAAEINEFEELRRIAAQKRKTLAERQASCR